MKQIDKFSKSTKYWTCFQKQCITAPAQDVGHINANMAEGARRQNGLIVKTSNFTRNVRSSVFLHQITFLKFAWRRRNKILKYNTTSQLKTK